MKKESPTTVLESPDLVSFISLKKGYQPRPFKQSDGRIAFEFAEDVGDVISAFYSNEMTPIADFCKQQRLIRSMIFALKGGAGHARK